MKRKFTLSLCSLFMFIGVMFSQDIKVSGVITSAEDGLPVIGASVIVKGTTIGTISDSDGNFSMEVPSNAEVIVASYVGMKSQEVGVGQNLQIVLTTDSELLGEVVVTAMGISREKKSLGYAVQEVKSDDLTKAGQMNVANSLSGKVAGVQITSSGGQVGSSQRIVIRGNSSLGNNEPLIVVDGVPIANDQQKSYDVDMGSGINDINPEDIESISVLKGGSAALYGMRAGNGVILITTKSGKNNAGGVEIRYDGNFTVDQMYNIPSMQNKYGQGGKGSEYGYNKSVAGGYTGSYQDYVMDAYNSNNILDIDESWGPRLDIGLKIPQYSSPIVDGVRQATPWVSHPDNIKDFAQLGSSMNHSISLTNRTDRSSTRASLSYRDQLGTIPNTDQRRYSAALNTQMNVNKYVDFDMSLNYTRTESDNLPMTGYYSGNPLQSLIQWFGRQVDMKDLEEKWDTTDPLTGKPYNWNPFYHQNPYYTMHKNLNEYERNRLYGKTSLWYKPFDFLKFEGRLGYDYYDSRMKRKVTYETDNPEGFYRQYDQKQTEINADLIAYFNKTWGDFNVSLIAGANYRNLNWASATIGADMLTIPGLFTVSNAKGSVVAAQDNSQIRSNSVYASGSVGYKSMLYLDLSARNDWSSTINDPFFYPSVSASWIPTSTFDGLQSDVLTFLKLRAGWAKIGSATSAYYNGTYYSADESSFAGNSQFYLPTTYPPKGLRPETVKTWEVGVEANLFDNRLGIDAAYYYKQTTDQIMDVAISKAAGYDYMLVNAGEIQNKGIELQLRGTVLRTNNWNWDLTLNWSKDNSKIVDLYTDPVTGQSLTEYTIGKEWSTYLYAKPGEEWGSIYGAGMVRNDKGEIIVGKNGLPKSETRKIGSVTPDWLAGFRSDLSWKNLSLSFLLDYRRGGDVFSVTQMWGTYTGILDYTAAGNIREVGMIVGKDVMTDKVFVKEDGTPNDIRVDAQAFFPGTYTTNREFSTFDGSFLKLREVSLTYTFPREWMKKTKFIKAANASLIGNNLALLWVHSSNIAHIDPESSTGAGNGSVGMESGSYMPSRSFGLKVGLTF